MPDRATHDADDAATSRRRGPMSTAADLPQRIVVGANGAYWLDFGSYYSMPRVSDDNDPVEVQAVYVFAAQPEPAVTEALRHLRAVCDALPGHLPPGVQGPVNEARAFLAAVPAPSPAPAAEPQEGEPTTRAGRSTLRDFEEYVHAVPTNSDFAIGGLLDALRKDRKSSLDQIHGAILAIEAESARGVVERLRGEMRASRKHGVRWEPPVDPKIQRWYAEGYDRGLREADSLLAAYAEASEQEGEA